MRRYAGDRHQVETDLVTLTPDEPPPPPKPVKNFIKKNREKLAAPKKDTTGTVTLTQDQLNAILQSVGKVAGGSEDALKISIGNTSMRLERYCNKGPANSKTTERPYKCGLQHSDTLVV